VFCLLTAMKARGREQGIKTPYDPLRLHFIDPS